MLVKTAKSRQYANVFQMITEFTCADVLDCTGFENLLVWYAADRIANEIIEELEG